MDNTDKNLMTAFFKDNTDAEQAYQELLERGYRHNEISVLMSEETCNQYHADQINTGSGGKAAEGTGVGAALGGTLGAVIGAIVAIGTNIVLPGLGLIVAGPLAAALVGAGAGGATGGLVGALVGWGIPEETAREYETGIREGGVLLGFNPRNISEIKEIERLWKSYNGELLLN